MISILHAQYKFTRTHSLFLIKDSKRRVSPPPPLPLQNHTVMFPSDASTNRTAVLTNTRHLLPWTWFQSVYKIWQQWWNVEPHASFWPRNPQRLRFCAKIYIFRCIVMPPIIDKLVIVLNGLGQKRSRRYLSPATIRLFFLTEGSQTFFGLHCVKTLLHMWLPGQ